MEFMRPIRPLQRGFTLLEILMSVALGSIVLASGAQFTLDRIDDVKDQTTAQYQRAVTVAAERFIRDNLTTIAGPLAINGAPTAIQLSTIRNAGYLLAGTGNVNPYRQTPCVVVRRLTNRATGEPRLEALVTTEGGLPIPEKRVPFIAAQGGSYGGYVPATAPTTAQGSYGTWTTPLGTFAGANCSGVSATANRLAFALFFDGASDGSVLGDNVLHRVAIPGRPDLNMMNVALNMGDFDITNSRNVFVNGVVKADGAIVTATEVRAGADVFAAFDVRANRDVIAQRDVRAQTGYVYGQRVLATEGPTYFGQTELRRFGLTNATSGIQIRTGGAGKLYLGDNAGAGIGTYTNTYREKEFYNGHSAFSRDEMSAYLPGAATINVSEDAATGKKASISFFNYDINEGQIELPTTGNNRLRLFDNRGIGLGLETTGALTVGDVATFAKQTSQKGTNYVSADSWAYIARDGDDADNIDAGAAAGSAYLNDVYLRSIGKWVSEMDAANAPGEYILSTAYNDTSGWIANTTGRTLTVQSHGGNGNAGTWNECRLEGEVDGVGIVAGSVNNNNSMAKSCSIAFQVPPGSSWRVNSKPYPANANGRAFVSVYRN